MTFSHSPAARRCGAAAVLCIATLCGCVTDSATDPRVSDVVLEAKAAGSGGPSVRAAEPDSGLRNTTIDVRVLGSGFDNGSKAVWALAGDTALATTKITTNSTRFVKSGELVANITIAGDAPLARFDIVVQTARGKNGIGIELFIVKDTGPADSYSALFDDALTYSLRSDGGGQYTDGSPAYNPNCIHSVRHGGGLYQLRTIANTAYCKAVQRPAWRSFQIDFGVPSVDLDQDGVAEVIEDAPGRILVDNAFAQGVTSSPAKIFVLVVNSDGSTTQDTKYELRFRTNIAVTDIGNESRMLEALPGNAAVDIFNAWRQGGKPVGPPLRTIQLPFRVTLTPR